MTDDLTLPPAVMHDASDQQPDANSPLRQYAARIRADVAASEQIIEYQNAPALTECLSEKEVAKQRKLAERIRSRQRREQWRAAKSGLADTRRTSRESRRIAHRSSAEERWQQRAAAADQRAASPAARRARIHRTALISSTALTALIVFGFWWSAVNVQRNLAPGAAWTDPMRWLSYGVDAMVTVPIIVIMMVFTLGGELGVKVPRGQAILIGELALIIAAVALNAGPYLAAGDWGKAGQHAIVPVMMGIVVWLHSWSTSRFAEMKANIPTPPSTQAAGPVVPAVRSRGTTDARPRGHVAVNRSPAKSVRHSVTRADVVPAQDYRSIARQIVAGEPGAASSHVGLENQIVAILTAASRGGNRVQIADEMRISPEHVETILTAAQALLSHQTRDLRPLTGVERHHRGPVPIPA